MLILFSSAHMTEKHRPAESAETSLNLGSPVTPQTVVFDHALGKFDTVVDDDESGGP
jgi:hypothetical protein